MREKIFRNYVISFNDGSWFLKLNENREPELTSDLLEAHFFYDKQCCLDYAKFRCNNIDAGEIKVLKLLTRVEIVEEVKID